jgi:colicin import membrane protein
MSSSFLPLFRRSACSLAVLTVLVGAAAQAGAQQAESAGQSMEDRLRNQLRITTSQLEDAQNELAALKAGHPSGAAAGAAAGAPASPSEVESLKKDLARSQAQLAEERRQRTKSADTEAALKQATDQATQYHTAYDQLLKLARTSEAERQRLSGESGMKQEAVAQCEAKNTKLYEAGQEILHAYETVDLHTVLASREPFAAKARVKYDMIAQEYGDKLYAGRFDERSVAVPAAPAPAAAAPAQ